MSQNSRKKGNVPLFLWVTPEQKKSFIRKALKNGNTQAAEARLMISEYVKQK